MALRAGAGVFTVAVLAGELAAAAWPSPGSLVIAAPLVAVVAWRLGRRRQGWLVWLLVGVVGVATGAASMRRVLAPDLPATHVTRLSLPLRTTLVGRIVASPEGRPG